jgi:hypothetical protein
VECRTWVWWLLRGGGTGQEAGGAFTGPGGLRAAEGRAGRGEEGGRDGSGGDAGCARRARRGGDAGCSRRKRWPMQRSTTCCVVGKRRTGEERRGGLAERARCQRWR